MDIIRHPQELSDERRYDVPVTVISTEFTSEMRREWIEQVDDQAGRSGLAPHPWQDAVARPCTLVAE